jgi:hypothetical protein
VVLEDGRHGRERTADLLDEDIPEAVAIATTDATTTDENGRRSEHAEGVVYLPVSRENADYPQTGEAAG